MHLIDQGTITAQSGTNIYLFFLVCVTLVGIFIWSAVVAILNEGLREKLNILRNKTFSVQEKNHAIILGWDESIPFLIDEYKRSEIKTVFILSNLEQDTVYAKLSLRKTKEIEVIAKQENSLDTTILEKLNISECATIVILQENDTMALKQLLALKKIIDVQHIECKINVSVIISQNDTEEILKSISIEPFKLTCINREDLLLKLTVQSIVFKGLYSVYSELFSYTGNEFYIIKNPLKDSMILEIAQYCFDNNFLLIGYTIEGKTFFTTLESSIIPPFNAKLIVLATESPDGNKRLCENIIKESSQESFENKELKDKNILTISKRELFYSIIDSTYKDYVNSIHHIPIQEVISQNDRIDYLTNLIREKKYSRILLNSISESDDDYLMSIFILIKHILASNEDIKKQVDTVLLRINGIQNIELLRSQDGENLIVSGHIIGALLGQASLNPEIFEFVEELLNSTKNEFGIVDLEIGDDGKTFTELYKKYITSGESTMRKTLVGIMRNGKAYLNPYSKTIVEKKDRLIVIADFVEEFNIRS